MEMSGQLHAPTALPPVKQPWYPFNRRLGGSQSRSGSSGEEKNSQPVAGLEPPIIQPVAQSYTAELSGSSFIWRAPENYLQYSKILLKNVGKQEGNTKGRAFLSSAISLNLKPPELDERFWPLSRYRLFPLISCRFYVSLYFYVLQAYFSNSYFISTTVREAA
jgi:hypothetical protein